MSRALRGVSSLSRGLRRAIAPGLLATVTIAGGCAFDGVDDGSAADHGTPARPTSVERLHRSQGSGMAMRASLAATAVDYVRSAAAVADPSRSDWKLRTVERGADGLNHVRLDQTVDGIRVWGADVVVHGTDASVNAVDGTFVPDFAGLATQPTLSAADALAVAQTRYAAAVPDPDAALTYDRASTELVILPREGEAPRMVWHTVFHTELQGGMSPGLWNTFVDAESGDIVEHFNAIHSLSQASGPGGNERVARTWRDALDVEPSGPWFAMDTSRQRTTDMSHGTSGVGTTVIGRLDAIGDAAINDAHGLTEVTLNMLRDWMGRSSIDDRGLVIISRVHYGESYENAFWDGVQMNYGDGGAKYYPLSGDIDVVAHEINHGFTTSHSALTYARQSGALNESFSDIAGTIAEFYSEGAAADFDIGRDIRRDGGALRYLCNPTADGISIDHAASYDDSLDVHRTSGVMNKAFCRSARRLSGGSPDSPATVDGVRRAGQAWYLANASYWTRDTGFVQGCQGVLSAARALHFAFDQVEAIRQSWSDVGVTCEGPPTAIAGADYDGDGKADHAVKDGGGTWRIDYAANGFGTWDEAHAGYGGDGARPVPADYDGDRKADLAVKDTAGTWYIDYAANGFGTYDAAYAGYGDDGARPVPADYDGDRKADLAVKDAGGNWLIDYAANGFGHWDVAYGGYAIGAPAVPADYDGDRKADLAVKDAGGNWLIDYAANGFGHWDAAYGGYAIGAPAVPADYDGDRKADLAVKDAGGNWLIDYAANGFGHWDVAYPGYGSASTPMPADHDGDGRADLSVVDRSSWYVDYASGGFGAWNELVSLAY